MVMNQNQAILWIDSGDTLVDESTEIRPDESGVVFEAKLSEGAAETLRLLKREGYRIALVADGLAQSFENIYTKYNLRELFDAWIISEKVGCEKPSCEMFEAALEAMDLTEADKCRMVMAGNNLQRDILGANRFGIHSCHVTWSPRYRMTPETSDEVPEYRIASIRELPEVLRAVEKQNSINRFET